jgi:hypothetical protein
MEPRLRAGFDLLALAHASVADEGARGHPNPDLDLREVRRKGGVERR